jgi:DNA replication protein DnaC
MEKGKDLSNQEAILTKQEPVEELQNDAKEIIAGEKEKNRQRRLLLPFKYSEFRSLFNIFGTACLHKRCQNKSFVIDRNNEPVLQQLHFYATHNSAFEGDLTKGILLQGKYGCGKTILLETYALLHNHIVKKFSLNNPLLLFIKAVELQEQIRKQSVSKFVRRPMIIDEFGRESKTIQDYGNVIRPISELLSLRSDLGTLTHGTSNFTLQTLSTEEFYGGMIGDRLKMMFNFITLPGESRRI